MLKKPGNTRQIQSMAVQEQYDFRQAARHRWPQAGPVTGAGRFAVIFRCPTRPFVRLFEMAAEAQQACSAKCEHAFCRMTHMAVELEPVQPKARPTYRRIHMDD